MYPTLIDLSLAENINFIVSSYRFFGILAAIYLSAIAYLCLRRNNLSPGLCISIITAIIAAFFIGSRLLYVILYWPQVVQDPSILSRFHLSNFALYGGLAISLLAWWLINRYLKLPFFKITDRLAPHLGLSAAIIRIGCFLNGCCYGTETSSLLGIRFPPFSPAHLAQISTAGELSFFFPAAIHPTQLYEMTAALTASLAAWTVLIKKGQSGLAAGVFGLVFTAGRFITYFFRDFPAADHISNMIRGPVVYSSALIIFSAWIIIALKQNKAFGVGEVE